MNNIQILLISYGGIVLVWTLMLISSDILWKSTIGNQIGIKSTIVFWAVTLLWFIGIPYSIYKSWKHEPNLDNPYLL